MFNRCCVRSCDSRRGVVMLFKFPKVKIALKKWLKFVPSGKKNYSELCKLYVCQKHFEKRFITPKSRLRYGAYPTLLTPDEIINGCPDTPDIDTENRNPNCDHNYSTTVKLTWLLDHNYCKNINASIIDEKESLSCSATEMQQDSLEVLNKNILPEVDRGNNEICEPNASDIENQSSSTAMQQDSLLVLNQNILPEVDHGNHEICEPNASDIENQPSSTAMQQDKLQVLIQDILPELDTGFQEISEPNASDDENQPSCSLTAMPQDKLQVLIQDILPELDPGHQYIIEPNTSDEQSQSSCSTTALQQNSIQVLIQEILPKHDIVTPTLKRTTYPTPNCKKLYREYKNTSRKSDLCKRVRKKTKKISKETMFNKMVKGLTPGAKTLIWMQMRQSKKSILLKKNRGRRFTDEEKSLCLSIMNQSPTCYKFLQKILILPCKITLDKFKSQLKI